MQYMHECLLDRMLKSEIKIEILKLEITEV